MSCVVVSLAAQPIPADEDQYVRSRMVSDSLRVHAIRFRAVGMDVDVFMSRAE